MGSLENPLIHCPTISEILKIITTSHCKLVDHENILPKCEICWQNHVEFNSIKAQLYLIVQQNALFVETTDNLPEDCEKDIPIPPVIIVKGEEKTEDSYDDQKVKNDEDTLDDFKWNHLDPDLEMDKRKSQLSCPHCFKNFVQEKRLLNHIIVCKNKSIENAEDSLIGMNVEDFECAQCGKQFSEKKEITAHVRQHVKSNKSHRDNKTCRICSKRLHTLGGLKRHMRFHEKKNDPNYKFNRSKKKTQYSCNVCKKSFRYQGSLKRHREIRDGSNVNCKICDEKFCRNADLDNHMRIVHEEKSENYHCHHCQEQFTNYKLIHKHHKMHHPHLLGPTKPFLCDTCGLAMMDSAHLKRHTMIHRGIKPHKCDVCAKTFRLKAELKQHNRVHVPAAEIEKKYACPLCPKKFRTNVTLWRHKRFHTGKSVESFCPVCKLRITNPASLEKHVLRHASKGPRLFKCEECGKTFTKLKYMNQHRKVDHNIFTHLMLNPKSSKKKN